MKLERISSNSSFKRGREIQFIESPCTRPLKKMSQDTSFAFLETKKPFEGITRNYKGHLCQSSCKPDSSKLELAGPHLSLRTGQGFLQRSRQTTPDKRTCSRYILTPEATPLRNTGTENVWATSRVASASGLSIVTPREIKNVLVNEFSKLELVQPLETQHKQSHAVFEIPEIVGNILRMMVFLESANIPQERPCLRRNPQSYEHSFLMYKDEEKAKKAWSQTQHLQDPLLVRHKANKQGTLFSCMMVNRLWSVSYTHLDVYKRQMLT